MRECDFSRSSNESGEGWGEVSNNREQRLINLPLSILSALWYNTELI